MGRVDKGKQAEQEKESGGAQTACVAHTQPSMFRRSNYQSIHPDLRAQALSGSIDPGNGALALAAPYPTREQHVRVEGDYARAVEEYQKRSRESASSAQPPIPPPVRQPPTMLAAMHRPDLTAEARQKILQKIAPPIATLEKKYKMVFNSDARRNPSNTSPNDFTVDITADILPTKINGFEIVGYSLPQTEWSIEPYENSVPSRYGWCVYPGCRTYGIITRTVDLREQPSNALAPFPFVASSAQQIPQPKEFAYTGFDTLILAEMPLVRNPVTAVEVLDDNRVRLTFARRVGSCPWVLCGGGRVALENVGLQNVTGSCSSRFVLDSAESVEEEYQLAYFTRTADEGILPREALLQEVEPFVFVDPTEESLYSLTVSDPAFARNFVAGTRVEVGGAVRSLGTLYVRPAASSSEFADVLTLQLRGILAQRTSLESMATEGGGGGGGAGGEANQDALEAIRFMRSPLVDLEVIKVKPTSRGRFSHSHRFHLSALWLFPAPPSFPMDVMRWWQTMANLGTDPEVLTDMVQCLTACVGDDAGANFGLPKGVGAEIVSKDASRIRFASFDPPTMPPEVTTDVSAIPENSTMNDYFGSLNTAAMSVAFSPSDKTSPTFVIPIQTVDGTTYSVNVPAGEYRPWGLAVAITEGIRSVPQLRGLRIVATPVMLDAYGNSAAGFRFASTATVPQSFGLAFNTLTTVVPNIIPPARLGYRQMMYSGAAVYDPILLSVMDDPYAGFTQPITFPATQLGNGVPSPLPLIPYALPSFANRRLQIFHVGFEPSTVDLAASPNPASASASASASSFPAIPSQGITLPLTRATLFHHLQTAKLQLSLSPPTTEPATTTVPLLWTNPDTSTTGAGTIEGTPAGVSQLTAGGGYVSSVPFVPLPGPGRASTPVTAAALQSILAIFHNPTSTLDGLTLGQTIVDMWGQAGRPYGTSLGLTTTSAQDGDYRNLLILQNSSPTSSMFPPTSAIDSWIRAVVNHQNTRSTFNELASIMVRLLALHGGPTSLAGNNGGVCTTLVLGLVVSAYSSATGDGPSPPFLTDMLGDMSTLLYWKLGAVPLIPSTAPPFLTQGEIYYVDFSPSFSVTGTLDAAFVETFELSPTRAAFRLLPGCCIGPGPFSATVDYGSGSVGPIPVHSYHQASTGGATLADPVLAGHRVMFSYDAALLAPASPPISPTQAEAVEVDTIAGTITFTAKHNIQVVNVDFANPLDQVTINVVDGVEATMAKALMIAGNYRVTSRVRVLLSLRGTNRYPFDISAALADLGVAAGSIPPSPETIIDLLLDTPDPGISSHTAVTLIPNLDVYASIPDDVYAALPFALDTLLDPHTIATALIGMATLAPDESLASLSITRLNDHPFSMDFTTRVSRGIRCERLGFQEDEYVAPLTLSRFGQVQLGTVGSAIDIDRGSPPYVLLSIQINGAPTPSPVTQRPDGVDTARIEYYDGSTTYGGSYLDYAINGNVISIGVSDDPQLDRQIINATAYVQLGGDGSTLRMLDRQDDRSPILLPTSTYVNWVRFVVLRPDGTLYNFHGRRTMVALRFMSHPDNPNFLTAASGGGGAGKGAADHS